jgi:vitellogenic carboxypeptidase-like protein
MSATWFHIILGLLALSNFNIVVNAKVTDFKKNVDPGEPLFLTPYIKSGQIEEAKALSAVPFMPPLVPSYSGFITVNETHNTNMFFWFFPAQRNQSTAPVILWCEGGPGVSGLYSLFNENGPYIIDKNGHLSLREYSWHLDNHMIFMDNPIGAGFSFTHSQDGFLKSGTDATHLYNFITQFFTMFPEYQGNDFYASGVSFGGIFGPAIAHEIHQQNLAGSEPKINLKGLFVESPWSDPIRQIHYGNFLHNIGFLDKFDLEYVNGQTQLIEDNIMSGNWGAAYELWLSTLVSETSYVFNRTGLDPSSLYNYIGHDGEDTSGYYIRYVEQDFVRNAIHVGNLTYIPINGNTSRSYEDRVMKTVKPFIETLLNAPENYRVLFYAGQLDVITFHLGIENMVSALEWSGTQGFNEARIYPWKADGSKVSGFAKNFGKLTYVLMRNAGHDANSEQPAWGFDVMRKFTNNLSFTG